MKQICTLLFFILFCSNYCFATSDLINHNKKEETISVLDFGALGDGKTDDSEAFQKAILFCIKNGKTLVVPKTKKSYNLFKTIRVSLSKNDKIKIISNQAVIKPGSLVNNSAYNLTQFKEHVFLSIGRKINTLTDDNTSDRNYGTSIIIEGLIFDGINQKIVENLASYEGDIYVAVQFLAEEVKISRCEFRNIYGYAVRIHEVSNCVIQNCKFNNVGGRGSTFFVNKVGDFDAFGDAIYHAKVKPGAKILIENCSLIGKKSNNKRSRCGVTFEYSKVPYKVYLKNLNIEGYAKCLHVEETAATSFQIEGVSMKDFNFAIANVLNDNTEMYLKNCTIKVGFIDGNDSGDALAFLNYRSEAKIFVEKSILDFNGRKNAYQSAVGLVKVENSTVNGNNTNFFFADGNTIFINCRFLNFGGPQMSFFSNNPGKTYQIKKSTFSGSSKASVKANNVKLIITDK